MTATLAWNAASIAYYFIYPPHKLQPILHDPPSEGLNFESLEFWAEKTGVLRVSGILKLVFKLSPGFNGESIIWLLIIITLALTNIHNSALPQT